MSDEELERINQKKLFEMIKKQQEFNDQKEIGVVDLDSTNFEQMVSSGTPTLVDFWAEWCGPCRTMHPIFTRMARKFKKIRFARVNIDQNQEIATRLGIQSMPIFILFKDGNPVDKVIGAVGEPGINLIAQKYS